MATGSTDRSGGTASSTATSRATGPSISVAQKIPCIACASTNVALTGEQTINGIACVAGNRVLLKGQTNGAQNGPWLVSTGAWTRPADWDHNGDVVEGTSIRVTRGTLAGLYIVSTTGDIEIDTTSVTLAIDAGAGGGFVTAANNGSDFSSRIATLNTLFGTGANIAAAATLDLSDQTVMTGFYATITGNTGIGAITMDAEQVALLRFSGTPLITVSASFVGNNNGANIQIEAGDLILAMGRTGSVTRFFHFPIRDRGNSKWASSVASAATLVIPEGVYGHVTGTTGITDVDFGIAVDGRYAIVEFDGALTITHSSTLKCPNATNLSITAGDVVMFIEDVGDTVRVAPLFCASIAAGGSSIVDEWLPAGAFIPQVTNGPQAGIIELATSLMPLTTLDFSTSTPESAHCFWRPPKRWDGGTITFEAVWTAASGSGGVAWGIDARAFSDDDPLDTAYGTQVVVTDTFIAANDVHVTATSSALTIAGSPQDADLVVFAIERVTGNGSDTLAVDAKLIGVVIHYTASSGTDA